uniref:Uncharacterized protein n=1 Tax=Desulfovibrio sp. U5L TaxID=596152 RepID=I2Q568_9BACT
MSKHLENRIQKLVERLGSKKPRRSIPELQDRLRQILHRLGYNMALPPREALEKLANELDSRLPDEVNGHGKDELLAVLRGSLPHVEALFPESPALGANA